jgi:hypothetical protein
VKTGATVATALVTLAAAAATAGAQNDANAPERFCTPPSAEVVVGTREIRLPSSSTCYTREQTSGWQTTHGDIGAPTMRATPRFTVKRGTIVRFRFAQAPTGTVLLEVRRGDRLQSRAAYRLSPFETTWRARGRGGVLRLSVPFGPFVTPWGTTAPSGGSYVLRFAVR